MEVIVPFPFVSGMQNPRNLQRSYPLGNLSVFPLTGCGLSFFTQYRFFAFSVFFLFLLFFLFIIGQFPREMAGAAED